MSTDTEARRRRYSYAKGDPCGSYAFKEDNKPSGSTCGRPATHAAVFGKTGTDSSWGAVCSLHADSFAKSGGEVIEL